MSSSLTKKSLVLIFAYAPVGFGHLRVTDALYHGLPRGITPLLLGAQDQSVSAFYRFVSIHPITRWIMEQLQHGIGESIFTYFYLQYFRSNTKLLHQQLVTIIDQRIDTPETILVVATHFGLAHQLAVIKQKIEKKKHIKLVLVVQVTDDSPQHLWYVTGADMIFVPSHKTHMQLSAYAVTTHLPRVNLIENAYPVSPYLSHLLPIDRYMKRLAQADHTSNALIHMVLPLSGAAVGTDFFTSLVTSLSVPSQHFIFHIVAKSAPYTQHFLKTITNVSCVELHVAQTDRKVIDMYEQVYAQEVISIEITKPSEQAFKVLLTPRQRGGALLFFSAPVGRQEHDNLDFMRRHHLIPTAQEQCVLWDLSEKQIAIETKPELFKAAIGWRGILLPTDASTAATFISWLRNQRILFRMMHYTQSENVDNELRSDGVSTFWEKVETFITNLHQ